MNSESITPRVRESLWILALVVAPMHGGISAILIMGATLMAGFNWFQEHPVRGGVAPLVVAFIFMLYFTYFYLGGVILAGDLLAPMASMKGNIPLLVIAVAGCFFQFQNNRCFLRRLGSWSTAFVYFTALSSILMLVLLKFGPELFVDSIDQVWNAGRLEMFSRHPLMFGSMLITLSYMSLLGFSEKSFWSKWMAIMAIPVGILIVGLGAQARGPILVSLALTALAFWYVRISWRQALTALLVTVGGLVLTYWFLEPFTNQMDRLLARFGTGAMTLAGGGTPEGSTLHRMVMYELGWQAVLESPWWGYGYQNRFDAILPLMSPDLQFKYGHLHNAFLDHQIAGGLPGLAIFLVLLALPWILIHSRRFPSRDEKYFAALITLIMVGTGLSTEILGHYVHANFYGALIMTLAILVSRPRDDGLSVAHSAFNVPAAH